jgi:hypothetical protein
MSEDELFRDFVEPEKACSICRVSGDAKLITREEFVGCISMPITYCKPCIRSREAEKSAREYAWSHFCNSCNAKFKRPFFKNRKLVVNSTGWWVDSEYLCLTCYQDSIEKNPPIKDKPTEDLWGVESPAEESTNLW